MNNEETIISNNSNNEETTIMQPQNNAQPNAAQPQMNPELNKKPAQGNRVAATVATGVVGAGVGAAAAYGASKIFGKEDEKVEEDPKEEPKEEPVAAAPQTAAKSTEEVAPKTEDPELSDPSQEGLGYITEPGNGPTLTPVNEEESQVTGVQEFTTANGQTGQAVYINVGDTKAAVVDTDGDGYANVAIKDDNHNNQIETNEIHDISDQNLAMPGNESSEEPQPIQTSSSDDVQVLGVYEMEGEDGQTVEVAALTNGEVNAYVGDFDGNGYADSAWIDNNMNNQPEEGEVYDISNEQIPMSTFEDAATQQQTQDAQMQQGQIEQEDYTTYAENDQPDYTNDADVPMV